jgi:H/ACA ribonucleoprotein complex non-core subunit NAF1
MTENEDESLNQLLNELLDEIKLKIENEHINKKFLNLIQTSSSCSSSSSSSENENSDGEQSKLKFKPKLRAKPTKVKSSSDEDDDEDDEDNHKRNQQVKYLKTKNEITIDDLPPIEKLNLVLESSVNLIKIGRVISIVDNKLVVIQTLNNCQEANKNEAHPLDEDTILFDENRKGLGKIYETFGPVVSPFYSLRFNLNEIKESQLKVDVGSFIYYAPESTKYTKFIFNVDELRQLKGSDASWNNDNEPPVECIEYSDDEQERQAKRELKMRRAGI